MSAVSSNVLPVVFMDETGNQESDRFFVCGFLEVVDPNDFQSQLYRIRDQIKGLADRNRRQKISALVADKNLEELAKFARHPSAFELKFGKIHPQNLKLFQDLIKILERKTDIKFTAIIIDRQNLSYHYTNLLDMYKIVVPIYFASHCPASCAFMPDTFDSGLAWSQVVQSEKIVTIIPSESHSSLALQCCDVLSGVVGLALKDQKNHTNRDIIRLDMVKTFEAEFGCDIRKELIVAQPKYVSTWTLDTTKTRTKK